MRFGYVKDQLTVHQDGRSRTEVTGRTDLVENLLAHRRDGTPLLVPLASTGAFMRVLAAVADADEPVRIDPRAIRWTGEGPDRQATVDDIEHWLAEAVATGRTFTELGVPWAHRERDRVLVPAEIGGVEVARYLDGRGTIPTSSPRPFLHPVRTLAGVALTARHPADHDWHLGVGVAIPDVNGTSFWGGGTYVHGEGYVLLDNHGEIVGQALDGRPTGSLLGWTGSGMAGRSSSESSGRCTGGHGRADLEAHVRVHAHGRRHRHPQLSGQQGPGRWGLRRVRLAVPRVCRRTGLHLRCQR